MMRGLRCWGILCAVVVMMSLVSGGCIFKRKSYDVAVGDEGIALAYDVPDLGEFVEADVKELQKQSQSGILLMMYYKVNPLIN